ncbi:MAG TPA: delta-60 repeat domain-containing protein [Solirubrobacterales bacterium]|nr:delta-60 repeat domain-containing protein [Solirubrobacterales bacterium]
MLARFDAGGRLDPTFGDGGLLRLRRPDGDILKASVEQVVPLPDGKALVTGPLKEFAKFAFFVARLNGDGSYDRSFGDGGLVTPHFPCRDTPGAFHFEPGCLPSLKVALDLRRPRSRHPVLTLRARPSFDWAGIESLAVTLPESMRLAPRFRGKLRVAGAPEVDRVRVAKAKPGERGPVLFVEGVGNAGEVRLRLGAGGIVVSNPRLQRRPAFKVWAVFNDARWGIWAGEDRITRRVG